MKSNIVPLTQREKSKKCVMWKQIVLPINRCPIFTKCNLYPQHHPSTGPLLGSTILIPLYPDLELSPLIYITVVHCLIDISTFFTRAVCQYTFRGFLAWFEVFLTPSYTGQMEMQRCLGCRRQRAVEHYDLNRLGGRKKTCRECLVSINLISPQS